MLYFMTTTEIPYQSEEGTYVAPASGGDQGDGDNVSGGRGLHEIGRAHV